MLQEFRKFIARGNVIDMAVGVIIGAAFGKIVSSLVNDIIMPPIGLILNRVNFANLFIPLSRERYATLADAKAAGAATINYGEFLTTILEFLIVAFAVFILVRQVNRLRERFEEKPAPAAPTTRACPYCQMDVSLKATRCPHCTSQVAAV